MRRASYSDASPVQRRSVASRQQSSQLRHDERRYQVNVSFFSRSHSLKSSKSYRFFEKLSFPFLEERSYSHVYLLHIEPLKSEIRFRKFYFAVTKSIALKESKAIIKFTGATHLSNLSTSWKKDEGKRS